MLSAGAAPCVAAPGPELDLGCGGIAGGLLQPGPELGHLVNQQGAEFIGLGFETTGAMSPGALLLVKRLSTRADERGCQTLDADLCTWTARRWSTRFRQLLSLAVVSGVARAVIEGASRLHDRIHPPAPSLRLPPEAATWPPLVLAALHGAHNLQGALAAAPATGPTATAQSPPAAGVGSPAAPGQQLVHPAGHELG